MSATYNPQTPNWTARIAWAVLVSGQPYQPRPARAA